MRSSPWAQATPDYAIAYQPGTLLITPAPLTITANNASMVQGTAVPPLSVSYNGFVNGDSPASLATQPTVSTPATPLSPAGTYPIVAGGASSPNYAINYAERRPRRHPCAGEGPERLDPGSPPGQDQEDDAGDRAAVQWIAQRRKRPESSAHYSLATIPSNKKQKSKAVALSQATYNPANNTVRLVTRSALVLNPPLKLTIVPQDCSIPLAVPWTAITMVSRAGASQRPSARVA